MQTYGYIRVSTKEQNTDRQFQALASYRIPNRNLFLDQQSGKDFDRPAYRKLLRRLRRNDLLVLKSIDRLGRNYEEIITQWKRITKDIGADICIIDMPLLDTRRDKDLLGTFISDLVLQILSFVSQTEREYIRQRQAEGIAAAKLRGISCGRPKKEVSDWTGLVSGWQDGRLTAIEAAARAGISVSGFYKRMKRDSLRDV